MTKKYKPYRTANNRDIYKKYDNKRNRLENPQKYDNVKLFGFRSGKSYKMIPALLYYVLVISYVLFIKISERAQNVRRQHSFAAFIICVCALRNVDRFADLTLCQIGILPQIADAPVSLHVYHQTQYT